MFGCLLTLSCHVFLSLPHSLSLPLSFLCKRIRLLSYVCLPCLSMCLFVFFILRCQKSCLRILLLHTDKQRKGCLILSCRFVCFVIEREKTWEEENGWKKHSSEAVGVHWWAGRRQEICVRSLLKMQVKKLMMWKMREFMWIQLFSSPCNTPSLSSRDPCFLLCSKNLITQRS